MKQNGLRFIFSVYLRYFHDFSVYELAVSSTEKGYYFDCNIDVTIFLFCRKTDLFSAVTDEELDCIVSEVHRRHPNTGYKLMRGHLNARGVRVPYKQKMGSIHLCMI